jgi:hypothetical protein
MKKFFALLVAVLVVGMAFAGCKSSGSGSGDSGEGGEGGCSACGESACCGGSDKDAALDATIKMYTDGTIKVSPMIAMHSFVSVGQYWEVTSNFGGNKSVTKWQVAAKAKGTKSEFIVENDMGQGYILAYQIDAWAKAGTNNVKKAWIGKKGEKPKEIKLTELKKGEAGEAKPAGFVLHEDFKQLEMCDFKFDGEKTIIKDDGHTTETWVADNGWFGKLIKMTSDGKTVMELTGRSFDEKIEPWLKWDFGGEEE